MAKLPLVDDLHAEIDHLRTRHKLPSDDTAFVFWYCYVCFTDKEDEARSALMGGPRDINVDALYIDDPAETVFIVQAKYRTSAGAAEGRNDLTAFHALGENLIGDPKEFSKILQNADPLVAKRLKEARERITRRSYRVSLHFVSTGTVAPGLFREFEQDEDDLQLVIVDRRRVLRLFGDYLEGAAPPVPSVGLRLDLKDTVRLYDEKRGIESWVISVKGSEIAKIYEQAGPRLFARNIRGFLGNTEINKGMRHTLTNEPDKFWYYNNGITIVCDSARQIREHGEDRLRVQNPQIINGQQTTRMLAEVPHSAARVLVRVMAIPRDNEEAQEAFGQLIENIVAAANRQNPIFPSDLRSNDSEQVRLERELRKLGYLYIRKRQTIQEAKGNAPQKIWWTIAKDRMAQAVAACFLDPYEVRLGKENLFGTDNYPEIFSNRPIPTYLASFWLRSVVRRGSKGKPERAYATWLVLHFLWRDLIRRYPGPRPQKDLVNFLETGDSGSRGMRSLGRAVDRLFQGALRFYRANRGTGEQAQDISTFFRTRNLHERFREFWDRRSNPLGSEYGRSLEGFVAAVQAAVNGQQH